MLDRLRSTPVPGRMIVELQPLATLLASEYDVSLEDGDSLTVPRRPETVSVVGQVYSPTAMLWNPVQTVEGYLAMAGGPTKAADEGELYVVRANGMVESNRGGLLHHLSRRTLSPGDTVVVPEEIETAELEKFKDGTQILYQLAVSVAAVAFLF